MVSSIILVDLSVVVINSVAWLVVKSKGDVSEVESVVKKVYGDVDKLISFENVLVNEVI